MESVRLGIIGLGNMGKNHLAYLVNGVVKGVKVTAVAEVTEVGRQWAKSELASDTIIFSDPLELIASEHVDGVLICTPHFSHPELAIACFEHGKHVIVEKPAGVYTKQVRLMNEASLNSHVQFSMMYNQRANPLYRKLKDLIESGELGEIRRTNWIITNWYRSQSYYDSGTWRATWAGEGGGVLLNQDPHQLDLWQWTIGMMPTRVRAFCHFGKHRNIEVEDDVTAYVEYENGATGVFITTTGEAPGTNRFEISGDRGKIIIENDQMTFYRLRQDEREFNASNTMPFAQPECWKIDIPAEVNANGHAAILQNWVNAILHEEQLIAPGAEGINGLTLANAMLLSTWEDNWVELPLDEELYLNHLNEKIKNSVFQKGN